MKMPLLSIFRPVEAVERSGGPRTGNRQRPSHGQKIGLHSMGINGRREFYRKAFGDRVAEQSNRTTQNPTMYTIGQAAKATGKSKSTISAAIKKGRISA